METKRQSELRVEKGLRPRFTSRATQGYVEDTVWIVTHKGQTVRTFDHKRDAEAFVAASKQPTMDEINRERKSRGLPPIN